jgi:hypothetical protein
MRRSIGTIWVREARQGRPEAAIDHLISMPRSQPSKLPFIKSGLEKQQQGIQYRMRILAFVH